MLEAVGFMALLGFVVHEARRQPEIKSNKHFDL